MQHIHYFAALQISLLVVQGSCSESTMKPYSKKNSRRGKFNSSPPAIPRWGRHRIKKNSIDIHAQILGKWTSATNNTYQNKVYDNFWAARDRAKEFHWLIFLSNCFILQVFIFRLFAFASCVSCAPSCLASG